jgi:hypothetical protein
MEKLGLVCLFPCCLFALAETLFVLSYVGNKLCTSMQIRGLHSGTLVKTDARNLDVNLRTLVSGVQIAYLGLHCESKSRLLESSGQGTSVPWEGR